ncbi:CAP domain-containing protein [Flavobacterium aquidurense]|uniref:CAP domain-containing protein n=1 Tax=Flavobacterium aquidurense TaxID=362413 RepID=UPI00286338A9|nr:CAP domain-containing protein [Flavobacterium aquidurense]MDR7371726.1 uncharacterized protein YkwD [Flavobacterium aquidurense]
MMYKWSRIICAIIIFPISNSCTSDSVDSSQSKDSNVNYTYTVSELEAMDLINKYRADNGLNVLEKIDYVSFKAEEHNNYMIATHTVTHDGFVGRSDDIIKVLEAKNVSENIAYNYNSPKGAFESWLKSPEHKKNIVGDFTNFGISIRRDTITQKIYYTNIFVKK